MQELLADLDEIRRYPLTHPELGKSHHFLFALPMTDSRPPYEILLIGINPGEQPQNWDVCPPIAEESFVRDWLDDTRRTKSSNHWRRQIEYFCGTRSTIMSEFFFWSSGDAGKGFREKFGVNIWESPHLAFCAEKNLKLAATVRPKMVICPGVLHADAVACIYDLEPVCDIKDGKSHRLVRHYRKDGLPWLFTKHWSGAFGFSKTQKEIVRDYIENLMADPGFCPGPGNAMPKRRKEPFHDDEK